MSDQPDAFGNYPSMPAAPPPQPAVAGAPPPPVANAVKLMFTRAGLSLLSMLVLIGTKSSLEDQILKSNSNFTRDEVNTAATVAITVGSVIGLVVIGLYILLALQVRKGKSWARIVTWVLAGLAVLSGLAAFAQPAPVLSRLVGLVTLVVDVAIIVLLALRPSSEYFRRTP